MVLVSLWRVIYSFSGTYSMIPAEDRSVLLDRMFSMMERLRRWASPVVLIAGTLLVGMLGVVWLVLRRGTRYLDQLAQAAASLASPDEDPIELGDELQEVQAELNLARERSLRNAMLAREAEQRKNDLVVYLAHDLKTPLTSVIGYLTLLRDEPDLPPAQRARYTGVALDKAERLESLINEFFDITRFSLTSLALEKERVSLTRMLEQTASEFEPVHRGRTIPPEKLGHIFQQFFRLDTSRGTATGGAGLGLAIAKEITEAHGGTIAAQSADEQIVFTVTLPL